MNTKGLTTDQKDLACYLEARLRHFRQMSPLSGVEVAQVLERIAVDMRKNGEQEQAGNPVARAYPGR